MDGSGGAGGGRPGSRASSLGGEAEEMGDLDWAAGCDPLHDAERDIDERQAAPPASQPAPANPKRKGDLEAARRVKQAAEEADVMDADEPAQLAHAAVMRDALGMPPTPHPLPLPHTLNGTVGEATSAAEARPPAPPTTPAGAAPSAREVSGGEATTEARGRQRGSTLRSRALEEVGRIAELGGGDRPEAVAAAVAAASALPPGVLAMTETLAADVAKLAEGAGSRKRPALEQGASPTSSAPSGQSAVRGVGLRLPVSRDADAQPSSPSPPPPPPPPLAQAAAAAAMASAKEARRKAERTVEKKGEKTEKAEKARTGGSTGVATRRNGPGLVTVPCMSHQEPCASVTLDGLKRGDFRTHARQGRLEGRTMGVRIGEAGFVAPILSTHLARPNATQFRRKDGSVGSWRYKVAGTVRVGKTVDCTDPKAVAAAGGWRHLCSLAGFDPSKWSKRAPPLRGEAEGRKRFFTFYHDARWLPAPLDASASADWRCVVDVSAPPEAWGFDTEPPPPTAQPPQRPGATGPATPPAAAEAAAGAAAEAKAAAVDARGSMRKRRSCNGPCGVCGSLLTPMDADGRARHLEACAVVAEARAAEATRGEEPSFEGMSATELDAAATAATVGVAVRPPPAAALSVAGASGSAGPSSAGAPLPPSSGEGDGFGAARYMTDEVAAIIEAGHVRTAVARSLAEAVDAARPTTQPDAATPPRSDKGKEPMSYAAAPAASAATPVPAPASTAAEGIIGKLYAQPAEESVGRRCEQQQQRQASPQQRQTRRPSFPPRLAPRRQSAPTRQSSPPALPF